MRPLWWTLAAVWIAVFVGGMFAAQQQKIALTGALVAAMVAGAIEASFYAAAGFERARAWVGGLPSRSFWIFLSALPGYLIYSFGTGSWSWRGLLLVLLAAAISAWWYDVLPVNNWTDGAFLAFLACGLLTELAAVLYPPLSAKLKTDFIGRVLWLRLGYWALLVVRGRGSMGFGFVPRRRDWLIGLRYAGYCTVAAAVVLWLVQPMKWKDNLSWTATPWVALGTFVAFLWVVALSEELLARGVLQGGLTRALGNEWAGVIVTSALFGLAHLTFGHRFPNWRMVALAGVLGVFCGRAAQLAGSIQASMVTHALVVTVYRVFLTPR